MKKITYIMLFALAAMLSFTACDREKMDGDATGQDEGTLNLASLKGLSVDVSATAITRTSDAVDTDNFLIRIYDEDENLTQEWVYSELPEIFTLKVGSYTVQALSHEVQPAEFEKPYYYAEESFTITVNTVTDLEPLVCTLHNIQVSVSYDDKLEAVMGDDVVTTVTVGESSLEFAKDETRSGYFQSNEEDSNILTAVMTGTIDGETRTVNYPVRDVKAGQHRLIQFYLKYVNDDGYLEGGFVSVGLQIVAQCTVIEKGVVVSQEEEVITDPNPSTPVEKPTIECLNFDIDENIEFNVGEKVEVNVKITSPTGLSNLKVQIVSEYLTKDFLESVGLTNEFDLTDPGIYEEGLKGLGFPVGDEVTGATELSFAITEFTPLLLQAGTHQFVITAVDQNGSQTEKTLTLTTK